MPLTWPQLLVHNENVRRWTLLKYDTGDGLYSHPSCVQMKCDHSQLPDPPPIHCSGTDPVPFGVISQNKTFFPWLSFWELFYHSNRRLTNVSGSLSNEKRN